MPTPSVGHLMSCYPLSQKLWGFLDVCPNGNTWWSVLDSQPRHVSFPCQCPSTPDFSFLRGPSHAPSVLSSPFSLTHTDAPRASIFVPRDICPSTYSHVTFHSLTSVAGIPWVWKLEMFPWLLRLVLARPQEKGVRGQAQSFCLTPDHCWGLCHGKVTSPHAWALSQWDDTIRHSRSVLLLLHRSSRTLSRWKLSFKLRDVARASFSDLWSRPGFPKLQKTYSWPSSLLVICVKWKHCFVRNIVPLPPPQLSLYQVLEIEQGCWERDLREEHVPAGTYITLAVTIAPAHMERDPGDIRKKKKKWTNFT